MKEGLKFGVENARVELLYSIIFYNLRLLHSVECAKYRTLSPVWQAYLILRDKKLLGPTLSMIGKHL